MIANRLNLAALMQTPIVCGLDTSPDGSAVVFSTAVGGPPRIYVRRLGDNVNVPITDGREGAVEPKWSPRGDLIAFLQDTGGDENYQVYTVAPDGSNLRNLTNAPDKLHENHAWSWDGSRVTYVSNRDGQFDVYYSELSGRVRRVTNHPSVHHGPQFSPDGARIAYASNRSELINNWDTFVMSLEDGTERRITQHQGEADEMSYYANQAPRWSPDGTRVLISSSIAGSYDLLAIDPETLERESIASRPWDESNGQWSPDGRKVAYTVNQDGNLVLYVQDLETGESHPVSPAQGESGAIHLRGHGGDYRWSRTPGQIVYSYTGPVQPDSIWIADELSQEPRALYAPMPNGIESRDLVEPDLIHYASFDGRRISAFLYRSPAESRGRALVLPHGGPTGQTINAWSPPVQFLVSCGFTVLAPNFRGSTGYGTEFQWLNRNDWAGGDLRDVVAGRDWLVSEGVASDVGILGGSYGGYLTLSAITQFPAKWQAAVSFCGFANLVTAYESARPDMRAFQERNIGTPDQHPDFYRERSPVNYVDRIACPLLLVQGERDPRVLRQETEQMAEALRRAGKTFECVLYPDEGHSIVHLEHTVDAFDRVARFFEEHFGN